MVGSGLDAPCKHRATFTRQPKLVLTTLGDNPRLENSLENEFVSATLGRSSATATQVRTQDKLMPFCCGKKKLNKVKALKN